MRDCSALPKTSAEVQSAVDAGLVTWPEVLRVLREDLCMPEGAIVEWRSGERDLSAVLVEWIEHDATNAERAWRENAN